MHTVERIWTGSYNNNNLNLEIPLFCNDIDLLLILTGTLLCFAAIFRFCEDGLESYFHAFIFQIIHKTSIVHIQDYTPH
jgi:hypothetical protein